MVKLNCVAVPLFCYDCAVLWILSIVIVNLSASHFFCNCKAVEFRIATYEIRGKKRERV